ncbi:MAG TPA: SDR family NAD(P)-dependent oxidoreductase [Jatrophihabitantaceae bacterium]|nr:SDR family NAD(P)-dependent oxidoreductase [Jatrophihabitantaceae bacterium]
MYEFSGQTALVTGGAAGLGFAIAERLAQEGAAIAIVDVDPDGLAEAAARIKQIGVPVHGVVADVSCPTDVEAAVASVESTLGPISKLVNNAGICLFRGYTEYSDDDFDHQLAVNVKGTHNFMSRVVPGMLDRGSGAVVNIASVAAFSFTVPHAVYAASKAAIIALTRDAAFELAGNGVRLNCVAPGLIAVPRSATKTPMLTPTDLGSTDTRPMGFGKPADIAAAVAFLLSDEARFIVGQTLTVAGGTDLRSTMAFPGTPVE